MNMQLIAKKMKTFFEINNNIVNLEEKINVIKNEFPWYVHYDEEITPIDVVLVDNNSKMLKYSIKSIKENMPWVNMIYVVSNNEIKEEKVITITPDAIIPNAFKNKDIDIALFLHNIDNLSERFIYVYSGTLFNYISFEDEFFRGNKVCMKPINFKEIPKKYKKVCYNNNKVFLDRKDITCAETFRVSGGNFGYMFSKTCCPMLKSSNKSCFEVISGDLLKTTNIINHLIYPTWTRIMHNNVDFTNSNVSIEEHNGALLELSDPIYKIFNIPNNIVDDTILNALKEKYNE